MRQRLFQKQRAYTLLANRYAFLRYLMVSFLALAVDTAAYCALSITHLLPLPEAAAVGYLTGLVVSYFLIAGRVFQDGWLSAHKWWEFFLFGLSGFLGLALTYMTVRTYLLLIGEQLLPAKVAAVTVSFFGVYLFRKYIVFSPSGLKRRMVSAKPSHCPPGAANMPDERM